VHAETDGAVTESWRASARAVAGTFAWSRAAIWGTCVLAFLALVRNGDPSTVRRDDPTVLHDVGWPFDVLARWDSRWFVDIARDGYDVAAGAPAFYPLYPGAVAVAGRVLGGHYVVGGVLVSLAATFAAFVLLHRLGTLLVGRDAAQRAVLYLAVFPMALFLGVVYGEALFLALALAAFLAAERRHFALAGLLAGLSLLARPTGVAVLAGIAVLAWQRERRAAPVAWTALALPVFALFPLVLRLDTGDPWAFVHVERLWYRETATLGPLGGLWDTAHAAWASLLQLAVGSNDHPYWVHETPDRFAVWNLESTAFFVLYVALAVVAWRRLGAGYGTYCAVALVAPLAAPTHAQPLLSMPRFGLVLFPLFLALALVARTPRVERAVVAVSSILLGFVCVEWALWQWVS
jgi:hypothetical protein